jgi:hypothetical protein
MLSFKEYLQEEKTVYHISHKDFSYFDEDKIGSAIGQLLFGWGFYFSDSKSHVLGYKSKLYDKFIGEYNSKNNYYIVDGKIIEESDSPQYQALINFLNLGYEEAKEESDWIVDLIRKEQYLKQLEYIKTAKIEIKHKIKNVLLYNVNLLIKDDEFLLWDEPLHKQSDKIQNIVFDLKINDEFLDGQKIYKSINTKFNDYKKTSKFLLSKGIKGIKAIYWQDVFPQENVYVVFSSEDIKIISKENL